MVNQYLFSSKDDEHILIVAETEAQAIVKAAIIGLDESAVERERADKPAASDGELFEAALMKAIQFTKDEFVIRHIEAKEVDSHIFTGMGKFRFLALGALLQSFRNK